MDRWIIFPLLLGTLTVAIGWPVQAAEPRLRYPVAVAWASEQLLAVANERSGSLSLVDVARGDVQQELELGKKLSDLVVSPDNNWLLVADEVQHQVRLVSLSGGRGAAKTLVTVSDHPVSISLARDGRRAFVACLWSHRLDALEVAGDKLRVVRSLELPFAPRHQRLLPGDRHLIVADAFGGNLAVIDAATNKLLHIHKLQAHNIGRMAWDEANSRLLIPHQILLETAATDVDNIQWGALMKNVVRNVTAEQLLDSSENLTTATRVVSLGSEGEGNADPNSVLALGDGSFVVTSGGSDHILRVDAQAFVTARIAAVEHPVQVLPSPDTNTVVVLNQFSDSLSIVDLDRQAISKTISLGPQRKLTPGERGERLFFSTKLAYEGWMTCHSCHTNGYTNGLRADTRGDGDFGAPKRTLSLLGVRDTDRWAWNGSIQNLQDQTRKSIESTLHGQASVEEIFELTAYLHTLDAPPPRLKADTDAERAQVARGKEIFLAQRCDRCHVPPLTYTSQESYDVGLSDEHGQSKFNPPSLRGVGHGAAFLHDGRARALEDVFQVHGHQLRSPLSDEQAADLVRFLKSL